MKMNRILIYFMLAILCPTTGFAASDTPQWETRNSVAGFFPVENTGRSVWSLNPGWLLCHGDVPNAHTPELDDSRWTHVSLPNGIELLPYHASGGKNYQGVVWYRKHLQLPKELNQKKLFIHFEAIMGRSEVWLNGEKLVEHTGGYLPVIVDVTGKLRPNGDNVLAVKADNSDDGSYPPGKPQYQLDFSYFGGIYRDCWLIAHNKTYITDPNLEQIVAGGGLFVSYDHVSEQSADVKVDLHIRTEELQGFRGKASLRLIDAEGKSVWHKKLPLRISGSGATSLTARLKINQPSLWSPESPYLYKIYVDIEDTKGNLTDGYYQRIGIRSIEFRGNDGLWLNGKPYEPKLIGGNRHQDFAIVGNAQTNSMHRRDALKLRSAGMKVIRNAHYPQDPAFMDACDELGLFVIEATPGWQYWDNAPSFANHVYDDIRQIVRRDRNRPSVFLYEPILNETNFPETFATQAVKTVHEEYPYTSCACACDSRQSGRDLFEVWYCHPITGNPGWAEKETVSTKTYFTREFGDMVDDWNSQNSPSRAARNWGEIPQLIQACHYGCPPYQYTTIESLCQMPRKHIGGALWHPFEYQRGYHPDPLYSGIFDAFRQPKYSYYMFASQRNPNEKNPVAERGPMVYIANALTPFSPADVTIYSNCDEVRLTVRKEGKVFIYKKDHTRQGMPSPIITFANAWSYTDDMYNARRHGEDDSYLLAEGIIDGKVVATDKKYPARRPQRLVLEVDNGGLPFRADGSDIVTIICSVVDNNGMVRRLNDEKILFTVEGEGQLLGNEQNSANPVNVSFGTAPILLRATTVTGPIKVKAQLVHSGNTTVEEAEINLQSVGAEYPLLYDKKAIPNTDARPTTVQHTNYHQDIGGRQLQEKIEEVSRQQKAFE